MESDSENDDGAGSSSSSRVRADDTSDDHKALERRIAQSGTHAATLATLRQRMANARAERQSLKEMLSTANAALNYHHGTTTLDNVALERSIADTVSRIEYTSAIVAGLRDDETRAAAEHERLRLQNEQLRAILADKLEATGDLGSRLKGLSEAERRCARRAAGLRETTTDLQETRDRVAREVRRLTGRLGAGQDDLMQMEQQLVDSRLELDAERGRRSGDGTLREEEEDTPIGSTSTLLAPCKVPACVSVWTRLTEARRSLEALERQRHMPVLLTPEDLPEEFVGD